MTRASARVDSIETIDLTGSGDNTLILDEFAVYQLTEQRAGGRAVLTIRGDDGDKLILKEGLNEADAATPDAAKWVFGSFYELDNALLVVDAAIAVVCARPRVMALEDECTTQVETQFN